MKVKPEEIRGFCQSLLVTVKCSNKLSSSQQKVAARIEKMIAELQKYMLNEDGEKGGCTLQ